MKKMVIFFLLVFSIISIINVSALDYDYYADNFTDVPVFIEGGANTTLYYISVNRNSYVLNAVASLTPYKAIFDMDDPGGGYFAGPLRNISGDRYYVNLKAQNLSIINKTINKISWKWKCSSDYCSGNVSYKVRYRENKSILAECNYGFANVSHVLSMKECNFDNFNSGFDDMIYTIERIDPQNSTGDINVYGEGTTAGQDINGFYDYYGYIWRHYANPSYWEDPWECDFDVNKVGRYYVVNISFADGKSSSYSLNPRLFIGGENVWSYLGVFNGSDSFDVEDFSSSVNDALNDGACDCDGCYLSGGLLSKNVCNIPVVFSAGTSGGFSVDYINLDFLLEGNIYSPGGGSSFLENWNPEVYPSLVESFESFLEGKELNAVLKDLFNTFRLFIAFILRQPASLVQYEGGSV